MNRSLVIYEMIDFLPIEPIKSNHMRLRVILTVLLPGLLAVPRRSARTRPCSRDISIFISRSTTRSSWRSKAISAARWTISGLLRQAR